MELALFFVLPLIGGFAFATTFELLRYRTGREEAQRLYYRAALIGVVLAVLAAALHAALHAWSKPYAMSIDRLAAAVVAPLLEKERSATTQPLSPAATAIRVDAAIACAYAFLLGALAPLWNRLIRLADRAWTRWAPRRPRRSFLERLNLRAITDQLERLIAESLLDASLVQVTLNNAKVYVGSVLESPNPASPAKYFKIQPWMSGQRSAEDGRVTFNTYYDTILAGFAQDESKRRTVTTFQLVIPIDKVVSASGFDLGAYERFVREQGVEQRLQAPKA